MRSIGRVGTVVPVACVARPSAALLARTRVMYPGAGLPKSRSVGGVLNDMEKVDGLAETLTAAVRVSTAADGRIDFRDVGAFVIRRMIDRGGAARPRLGGKAAFDPDVEAKAVDMMAADALGKLIVQAIEKTQGPDGLTDMKAVAAHVLRAVMKERTR